MELRKILQGDELRIVEQITLTHYPAYPFQQHALGQILADAHPARRIAEQVGEGDADEIQQGVDTVAFRRSHQLPVSGLGSDQKRARDLGIVGNKAQRLAAEEMAALVE